MLAFKFEASGQTMSKFRRKRACLIKHQNWTHVNLVGRPAPIVMVVMATSSFILEVMAMVLFARRRLQPSVYLVFQCVKTCFWTIFLILDVAAVAYTAKSKWHKVSTVSAALPVPLDFLLSGSVFIAARLE